MVDKLCILVMFSLSICIQCEVHKQEIRVKDISINFNNNEEFLEISDDIKSRTPNIDGQLASEYQLLPHFQRQGGVINDKKCPVSHVKIGFICVKESQNKY